MRAGTLPPLACLAVRRRSGHRRQDHVVVFILLQKHFVGGLTLGASKG